MRCAMPLLLALMLACRALDPRAAADEPSGDNEVADSGIASAEDTGLPADSGVDSSEDSGADTATDTATDSGGEPLPEYPVEPPEWPDCPTLTQPIDFGGDGARALVAVAYSVPGVLGPVFGTIVAFGWADEGACEDYSSSGDMETFNGSCTPYEGVELSGFATNEHLEDGSGWQGAATGFSYRDYRGSGWDGDGAWESLTLATGYAWRASGYDYTAPTVGHDAGEFRGGFDRDDAGSCAALDCSASGYVHAFEVMDVVDGEFCYALATASGFEYVGPGVLRVVGTERIEIVLIDASNAGYYTVDGGEAIAF